ncbi:MAG: MobA/MobL family protein [Oscillospiraceae bacterium]|nr:MobA/MobL family protein [Oscillospiraceae bacterium]
MSIKIISRGNGASAVCKAAYRAGEILESQYDGRKHDYSKKYGVIHKEILLPENAPQEYINREFLWNAVEYIEKQSNAQLAREIEISLPVELTSKQNIALARKFVYDTFVKDGMCADICIHDTGAGNPHAHIMLTMRPIDEDGNWGAKAKKEYVFDKYDKKVMLSNGTFKTRKINLIDWNDKDKAEYWRKLWAEYQNKALKHYGHDVSVNHRSYQRQGIEQIPAVHLGYSYHLEHRGIQTEQGDRNRQISQWNRELRMIKGRIKKLKTWLYEQPIEDAPTMSDVLKSVTANNRLKSKAQKLQDIKTLGNVINFCKEHDINSIESFADRVSDMQEEQYDIAKAIKEKDRKIKTLDTHLHNVVLLDAAKPIYKKYTQLDPRQQDTFRHANAAVIEQYEAAHKYIKDHLNGKTVIPEKTWRKEREQLLQDRYTLTEQFYGLKNEIRNLEVLRRGAERVMDGAEQTQEHAQDRPRRRTQEPDL